MKSDATDRESSPRGPWSFPTLKEWVESPEYAEIVRVNAEKKQQERALRLKSKQKTGSGRRKTAPSKKSRQPLAPRTQIPEPDPAKGRRELCLPQWLELEMRRECPVVTPEAFSILRKLIHQMTVEQCAALLRVSEKVVCNWEAGYLPIPFAAYMALRLLGDVRFLPHDIKAWEGWKIINAGPDIGLLYDEVNGGALFSPEDIRQLPSIRGERDSWQRSAKRGEARIAELEAQLAAKDAENLDLRRKFQEGGVTRELRQMHEHLSVLLSSIGTAEVIEFTGAADQCAPLVRAA